MISRRAFVASSGWAFIGHLYLRSAWSALNAQTGHGSLVPESGAKPALLVDPATAIMVAKTGLEVYRMVKGGGGGVENLLVAQTEMLRAISAQIAIVNDGIQLILAGVEGLKSMIRDLPSDTVRAIVSSDVQAAFVNIAEKLERLAMLRERYGQSYAIAQVNSDAALNLSRLEHSRAALMGDVSPVIIPLVCAAWYVEFQALTSLVPFERERVLSVARSYDRWAGRIAPTIEALLAETVTEVRTVESAAKLLRDPGNPPTCRLPISTRMLGAYIAEDSSTTFVVHYRADSTEKPVFAMHFDELQQAGVAVAPELRALRSTTFDFEQHRSAARLLMETPSGPVSTMNDFRAYAAWRQSIEQYPQCTDPTSFAKPNADKLDLAADVVREKALMHYHFYLAHREVRKSIARAIERVSRLT